MTKKEFAKLKEELQRHGYKEWQPWKSLVVFKWSKTIQKAENVQAVVTFHVWDHSDMEPPCYEVEGKAAISGGKLGFNVKISIGSRENLDILQLEAAAYSMLNLLNNENHAVRKEIHPNQAENERRHD